MAIRKTFMLLIFALIGLTLAGCTLLSESTSEEWERAYEGMQLDMTFDKIKVSSDLLPLYFARSSNGLATFTLHTSDLELVKEEFVLNIQELSNNWVFDIEAKKEIDIGNHRKRNILQDTKIFIQLPEDQFKEITASNEVGRIHMEEINADHVVIHNEVGDIQLDHVNGETNIFNEVGNVRVHVEQFRHDMTIHTETGSVTMTLEEEPEQLSLNLSSELGHIETNLSSERSANGPELTVKSELGSISVHVE